MRLHLQLHCVWQCQSDNVRLVAGENAAAEVQSTNSAPDRAAILAELASLPAANDEPAEEPSKPAADPEVAPPEEEAPAAAPVETEEDPADAETSKRLATVQKQEERARAALAKERSEARAELDTARKAHEAEWAPKMAAYEQFEAAKRNARRDPAALLTAAGLTADDLEAAAAQIYALSPKGGTNAANKAHAEKLLRERENETRYEKLERELAEVKQAAVAREQAAAQAAETERYVGAIESSAKASGPAIFHLMNTDADMAGSLMSRAYEDIMKATGETPDPKDVVAEAEKAARVKLVKLGVNLDSIIKGKAAPAEPETKRTTKTLSTSGSATQPKTVATTKTAKEEREEVLREMAKLQPATDE